MEGFALAFSHLPFVSSVNPQEGVFRAPHFPFLTRRPYSFSVNGKRGKGTTRRSIFVSAFGSGSGNRSASQNSYENDSCRLEVFSSISSSSSGKETSYVGVSPQYPTPPSPSQIGSPLFWVGVGVAVSALFSWVASYLKKYAMQQAFKTMMGQNQMASQNSPFNSASFSSSPPFPFPSAIAPSASASSPAPVTAEPSIAVDVTPTKVETAPAEEVKATMEARKESRRYEFVDVSPEELVQKQIPEPSDASPPKEIHYAEPVLNGSLPKQGAAAGDGSHSTRKSGSVLSVDALEKMMEDPTVQKMVFPYLPEEMRNPTAFKWMLQNPQYRQQLEDMLNNMGGSSVWDNKLMDSLKNFDLGSPEVKQQFDQIGLTPEEVISKIMANPDVAMAFQNPRVQAAIMDCSQNPMNITKYQNDKEVMDVFNKISELFPGVGGPL